MRYARTLAVASCAIALSAPLHGQTFRSPDPVIRRMWSLGMDSSQVARLAQVLVDSIGMRLSGTSSFQSAVDWLTGIYRSWGVTARQEQYGTARGWRMGPVSAALLAPHVQTVEVQLLAWSPGTNNRPVDGEAVIVPALADSTAGGLCRRLPPHHPLGDSAVARHLFRRCSNRIVASSSPLRRLRASIMFSCSRIACPQRSLARTLAE